VAATSNKNISPTSRNVKLTRFGDAKEDVDLSVSQGAFLVDLIFVRYCYLVDFGVACLAILVFLFIIGIVLLWFTG
jgi:hypothetical protein